ncbi:leucine-rich repeat and fibronectin type-III domain-containing protein 5-like isoform X2 [Ornithodoros turicata]|uniref:leucine-rich repeat and fibronectin type-III domain-containing protein 5-like isoform X2 n=1 Tax=Ornithodoros turicata TaxID=34597 RepID=UPI003138F6FE
MGWEVLMGAVSLLALRPVWSCPSREFIYPCSCMQSVMGTHVMCSAVDSTNSLVVPFQYLRDYSVTRMLLTNLNLSAPGDLFWGLQMDTLKVVDSTFQLTVTCSVTNLELMRSVADMDSVASINRLQSLYIQNSTMRRFERLAALTELTQLSVDSCQVVPAGDASFIDIPSLVQLTWTNNALGTIRRSFFPRNSARLKNIDLSDNKLSSLPDDIFTSMPVLETVLLSRNAFHVLLRQPWVPVLQHIKSVHLDGNPLVCNTTCQWLVEDLADKVSGTCAAPPALAGRAINSIHSMQ